MENPIADKNFLLQTEVARELYHDFAAHLPIIDYHNHLPVEEISNNRKFENLAQLWLGDDHYKFRAMRANGINEHYITGEASDKEKFAMWSKTVPYTLRNPLYHWTHMELKKPFLISNILDENSAPKIYDQANELLQEDNFSVQGIIKQFHVEILVTTEDPIDTLEHHKVLKRTKMGFQVSTSWRSDRLFNLNNLSDYNTYLAKLSEASNIDICSYETLLEAIQNRHQYFHKNGCRISDNGLEFPFPVEETNPTEVEAIFQKILSNKPITSLQRSKFTSNILLQLSKMNAEKGWVQQYHIGAYRDVNSDGVKEIGQAKGFDSIHDFSYAQSMGRFLNTLHKSKLLTKTILYNLNSKDNDMVAAMTGNFQDGIIPGKIQYGAAWWFLDTQRGMENHINTLSDMGLLRRFVGMLTDSRSFLSFSRHEYFRRILCNILGNDVEQGLLPKDIPLLGNLVGEVCYQNAKDYFNFNEPDS